MGEKLHIGMDLLCNLRFLIYNGNTESISCRKIFRYMNGMK